MCTDDTTNTEEHPRTENVREMELDYIGGFCEIISNYMFLFHLKHDFQIWAHLLNSSHN